MDLVIRKPLITKKNITLDCETMATYLWYAGFDGRKKN
jgi:hypothetical protein